MANQEVSVGGNAVQLEVSKSDLTVASRNYGGKYYRKQDPLLFEFDFSGSNTIVWDCVRAPNGVLYVIGQYTGSANADMFLVAMAPGGEVLWKKGLSSTGSDIFRKIECDAEGNLYVSGTTLSSAVINLLKISPAGAIIWQKSLNVAGVDIAIGSHTLANGTTYITGSSTGADRGLFLAKLDTTGALEWQRICQATGVDQGYSVTADSTHVYVTGFANKDRASVAVVKFTTAGTLVWSRVLHSATKASGGLFIMKADDGQLYIGGRVIDEANPARYQPVLIKMTTDGAVVWQTILDSPLEASSIYGGIDYITQDVNGNLVVVLGYKIINDDASASFICRVSPAGEILAQQRVENFYILKMYRETGNLLVAGMSRDATRTKVIGAVMRLSVDLKAVEALGQVTLQAILPPISKPAGLTSYSDLLTSTAHTAAIASTAYALADISGTIQPYGA